MSPFIRTLYAVATGFLILLNVARASDVSVSLDLNRPLNDVSEKFVSFAVKPESLFRSIDGPSQITVTRMANLLGDSYIKFVGDFYFPFHDELTHLENPAKIIWKGFNRWTRAINWTMIIPVPYSPNSWEPLQALEILNTSYNIGITDCIWQLGTDFSSSRAQDYVNELRTFNQVVDPFRPFVEDWKIMGADVSAGSSVEETRRYVEMSKDLNAAFGWTQPALLTPANRMSTYIYENDPALKILLSRDVPVWLSLPSKGPKFALPQILNDPDDNEANHAFRWATTLGEAARLGFDVVFKPVTAVDLEHPSFSFYASVCFKKLMGSRVFPAASLQIFAKTSKLYTHCANGISGGLAMLLVNSDERVLRLSLRSPIKFRASEIWQYTLQQHQGQIWLNDERLTLNSDLMPRVLYHPDSDDSDPINVITPATSINFWVFPRAEFEHCQFAIGGGEEMIEADEEIKSLSVEKMTHKRYSPSDRFLEKLIQTKPMSSTNRRSDRKGRGFKPFNENRYRLFGKNKRDKRIPSNKPAVDWNDFIEQSWKKLFQPTIQAKKNIKPLQKRSNETGHSLQQATLNWLRTLLSPGLPLLKRDARKTDESYFKSLFAPKIGRKKAIIRKIMENKKPQKKVNPIFMPDAFDEEEYFGKIDEFQNEEDKKRFPQGDVHLTRIESVDADDFEEAGVTAEDSVDFLDDRTPDSPRKITPLQDLWNLEYEDDLETDRSKIKQEPPQQRETFNSDDNFQNIQFSSLNQGKRQDLDHHDISRGHPNSQRYPAVHSGPYDSPQQIDDFFPGQHETDHSFLTEQQEQQRLLHGPMVRNANNSEFPREEYSGYDHRNIDNYYNQPRFMPAPAEDLAAHPQFNHRMEYDSQNFVNNFNSRRQKRSPLTTNELIKKHEENWRENLVIDTSESNEKEKLNLDFNRDQVKDSEGIETTQKSFDASISKTLVTRIKENFNNLMESLKYNLEKWQSILSKYITPTPDEVKDVSHHGGNINEKD